MKFVCLILCLFGAVPVSAQPPERIAPYRKGPTVPSSCRPGIDAFFEKTTTTKAVYVCDPDGTWKPVSTGSGGGSPASPVGSIQFNNSGTFGGDANLTWDEGGGVAKALVVSNSGSAFGNLAIANNDATFPFPDSGTGFTIAQSTADATYDYNTFLLYTLGNTAGSNPQGMTNDVVLTADTNSAALSYNAIDGGAHTIANSFYGHTSIVKSTGSVGAAMWGEATHITAKTILSGNGGTSWNYIGSFSTTAGGTIGTAGGVTIGLFGPNTVNTWFSYYSEDLAGHAANPYYFWADDNGVFRIKSDNTFDSVYQAIPALYNPQFTKYTAGAANYERIVEQWNGNVGELGIEKGGTGTLRNLRLIGGGLEFGSALVTPASSGTRYLCISTAGVVTSSASACSGT